MLETNTLIEKTPLFLTIQEPTHGKVNIIGLNLDAITIELQKLGLEKFRAKQIWQWLYVKGVTSFFQMTSIAKPAQEKLNDHFYIERPAISEHQKSKDGTQKWLLTFHDGQEAEMVFIPEKDRGTLCISSQVGCTLSCKFCHTGTQTFVRNLSTSEIITQVMLARDQLDDWKTGEGHRLITNIVLMGMGEPLYNYDNVASALKIIMDCDGIAFSKRKITLSTSGVVPMMERCGLEINVNLAVSLHATTNEIRDEIVPLNRKYPIEQLLDACRNYPNVHNARRITFEYVMLKNVNDSMDDAKRLIKLLKGIPAKINLIPFNPWPNSPFECSDKKTIEKFGDILSAAGFSTPVRKTRGDDIFAACGQLKSKSRRASKSKLQSL